MPNTPSSPRSSDLASFVSEAIMRFDSIYTNERDYVLRRDAVADVIRKAAAEYQKDHYADIHQPTVTEIGPVVDFFNRACDITAAAAAKVRRQVGITHGVNCPKVDHKLSGGWLHDADDDTPHEVDGAIYCGRCHHYLAPAQVRKSNGDDAAAFVRHCLASVLSPAKLYEFLPPGCAPSIGAILDAATGMIGMLQPEERTHATHSKLAGIAQWAREMIVKEGK